MSAVRKPRLVEVDEYLKGELVSHVKHEYVGGHIYAMTGMRNGHNLIAGNILGFVGYRLRWNRCRPFNSDTKIRIRSTAQLRFYYPDVSVICRPNPQAESFQDEPAVVFEVVSRKTRRIDEGEKKDAYLTIPSLSVYVLVEQETAEVSLYRRTAQGFVREAYEGLDAELPLPEVGISLPLSEVFDGVEFSPEPEEEE